MATKRGCAQQTTLAHNRRTVHPYVGCTVRANESVGLARPIKMSGGRGASSAVANSPVSPVSLTLWGSDEGEGALPVMGAALAMPRALPVSGLLAGLIKPLVQYPRHWGPEHMAKQEGGEAQNATT